MPCILERADLCQSSIVIEAIQLPTVRLTAVLSTSMMTIGTIDQTDDSTPVSFEGIPPEWEIKSSQIKLHCIDGKPVELGRYIHIWLSYHRHSMALGLSCGKRHMFDLKILCTIASKQKEVEKVMPWIGYLFASSTDSQRQFQFFDSTHYTHNT